MNLDYWILHADSLLHQVFMIVMGILQAAAIVLGVSYKAINIYAYFVFFPLSFALFLKTNWKYIFLPASFLFFLIPNLEELSVAFFDSCVVFLNESAEVFNSNYIAMSVYLCVLIPVFLYLPFLIYRLNAKQLKVTGIYVLGFSLLYLVFIYPFFKDALLHMKENYL